MKSLYEKEIKQLRMKISDIKIKLSQTMELYKKEKLEKETNYKTFNKILKTYYKIKI